MERLSYALYMISLLLGILMFGAVHAYVYTLVTLGVLVGSTLLVVKGIRKDHQSGAIRVRLPRTGLNLAFLVLLGFLVFQLTPLPDSVLRLLSPEAAAVWEKSWPAASLVGADGHMEGWASLAPYHYPVRMSILRLTLYGLLFVGLVRVLNSQKRIELTIFLLLAMGCFEALYGLIQAYSRSPHVLWAQSIGGRSATGTYINRNHFAGLMEMGMLLAASFSAALAERTKVPRDRRRKESFRTRLVTFLSGEQLLNKRILILFAGVVMGIGLIFSASRGGIIAAAGALLCMSLFLVLRKGQRRKGLILLALFVVTSAYALDIGVEYVAGRFKDIDTSMEVRSRYARKAIDMFQDYKVVGVGVGNFKYAYPKYQAAEDMKIFIRFAHNDWAQFLSEAGVMGMVLLLGSVGYYLFRTIRLWTKRSDPFAVCLGLAPVAALTALGIHSYSDFNLHIPANAMTLVTILAIGYSALHLERHHRRERMSYRYHEWPLKYRGAVALSLIFALIGWSGWWSFRHFMAEAYCNTVPNSTLNRDPHPPLEKVAKAIDWDPSNAEYWYKFAERMEAESSKPKAEGSRLKPEGSKPKVQREKVRRESEDKGVDGWLDDWLKKRVEARAQISSATTTGAVEQGRERGGETSEFLVPRSAFQVLFLEQAVHLNPFEALYHLRLGWTYAHLWNEKDYHIRWLPAADISMDRAAYFAGVKNPRLHLEMGNYWVMRSRSVYPNKPLHHEAWAKAVWHYRKAQGLEAGAPLKQMQKEIRSYVWNFYPDEEMVRSCLI